MIARAAWMSFAILAAACAANDVPTRCELTGVCLRVADGRTVIVGTPALASAHLFAPPVAASHDISSTFGPRWKLSANRTDFHLGIDYGELGTPLLAIGPGRVFAVYSAGSKEFPSGGNVLVVEHAMSSRRFHDQLVDRFYAVYLHAQTLDVAAGDAVVKGQRVGTMGMTGDTDFVHLHFETRVEAVCSLEYQHAHRSSECGNGYDPHVHPYLFVGGDNRNQITVEEIASSAEYAVRYVATRGDLDLDVIATDLGTIGFNEREGIDATSIARLDRFDYGFMRLIPLEFASGSETVAFELRFAKRPAFLELRDIYGWGIRFGQRE
jgi:hypothetical protein